VVWWSAYTTILVRKSLQKPKRKWEDSIKIDLRQHRKGEWPAELIDLEHPNFNFGKHRAAAYIENYKHGNCLQLFLTLYMTGMI
jgi:hypothetical protein